jgi:hypothetical protein
MAQFLYVAYIFFLAATPAFARLHPSRPPLPICIVAEAAAILLVFFWQANWAPWPPPGLKAYELVGYDLAYLIWLHIPGLAALAGMAAVAIWRLASSIRNRGA